MCIPNEPPELNRGLNSLRTHLCAVPPCQSTPRPESTTVDCSHHDVTRAVASPNLSYPAAPCGVHLPSNPRSLLAPQNARLAPSTAGRPPVLRASSLDTAPPHGATMRYRILSISPSRACMAWVFRLRRPSPSHRGARTSLCPPQVDLLPRASRPNNATDTLSCPSTIPPLCEAISRAISAPNPRRPATFHAPCPPLFLPSSDPSPPCTASYFHQSAHTRSSTTAHTSPIAAAALHRHLLAHATRRSSALQDIQIHGLRALSFPLPVAGTPAPCPISKSTISPFPRQCASSLSYSASLMCASPLYFEALLSLIPLEYLSQAPRRAAR